MGALWSQNESLKIKYIPGYEERVYGETTGVGVKKWHKWGITMSVIDEFIAECGGAEKLDGLTTRQVVNKKLKPQMRAFKPEKGCSYAAFKRRHCGSHNVRDAEIYVVHAWDSVFLDVISSIRSYLLTLGGGKDTPPIPIWFDVLCVNQCKPIKSRHYSYNWFTQTFTLGIEEIMHVMVVMTPWEKPLVFNRLWCMWELNTVLSSIREIKLGFALTTEQYTLFKASIAEDSPMTIPYSYFREVDQIYLAKTSASVKKHRATIMAVCEDMKGGEARVNKRIRAALKEWVVSEGEETIREALRIEEATDAQISLANIYRFLGRAKDAIPLLEKALASRLKELGDENEKTVVAAYMLGNILRYDRQFESALIRNLYCLRQRRKIHGDVHPETMHMIVTCALNYNNLRRFDDELALYEEMLACYQLQVGDEHEYTQLMRNNIGNMHLIAARFVKGKEKTDHIEEAVDQISLYKKNRIHVLGAENADSLLLMRDNAVANLKLQRYHSAIVDFQKVNIMTKMKYEAVGSPDHPYVLESMHNLAFAMIESPHHMDECDNTVTEQLLMDCVQKRKEILGYQHPYTIETRDLLFKFWKEIGNKHSSTAYQQDEKDDRYKYYKVCSLTRHLPDLMNSDHWDVHMEMVDEHKV